MPIRHDDPRPPSEQIAAELREAITSGTYAPGDQLPSTRALASDYGVADKTVQRALRELRNERLIVSQPGKGAFVQDPDAAQADSAPGQADVSTDLAEAQRMLREATKRLDRLEAQQRAAGPEAAPKAPERGPDIGP